MLIKYLWVLVSVSFILSDGLVFSGLNHDVPFAPTIFFLFIKSPLFVFSGNGLGDLTDIFIPCVKVFSNIPFVRKKRTPSLTLLPALCLWLALLVSAFGIVT